MWGEVASAGGAAVSLLGLGAVMGFSPSMYAIVVRMLTGASRPETAVRWICVGMIVGCTVMLLAFRVVDPENLTRAVEDSAEKLLVRRGVDLAAGVVFLVGAGVVFLRRRTPRPAPKAPVGPRVEGAGRMVLIGAANTVIGLSGVATMYVSGRVITADSRELWLQVILYGTFLTAVVAPYLLLAAAWRRYPGMGTRVRAIFDRLAQINTRVVLAVGLALAGFAFVLLGIFSHHA